VCPEYSLKGQKGEKAQNQAQNPGGWMRYMLMNPILILMAG
jgi:hypothetical protein